MKIPVARDDVEVNTKDEDGHTLLSYAAKEGHEAVVKLRVARNDVDVNSKSEDGRSPLSYAAENGHEAVMKLLQQ